jgi:hypothetical protein
VPAPLDADAYHRDVVELLATPPERILAVMLVIDQGPTRDESGREIRAAVRFRTPSLSMIGAMEHAVAALISGLSDEDREAWARSEPPEGLA